MFKILSLRPKLIALNRGGMLEFNSWIEFVLSAKLPTGWMWSSLFTCLFIALLQNITVSILLSYCLSNVSSILLFTFHGVNREKLSH